MDKSSIWSKDFDYINVAVKYFGVFFEFWQEVPDINENRSEFLNRVKKKYRQKFNGREIQLTFVYKPYVYTLE
jgi:midasin (ATPase involved in ribosome maturation)